MAKKKLKGIVVVGFDPALVPIIDKAVENNIPVVTVDADLPTSKRIAFVGTGNYQAGLKGGQKLAELIGSRGKVALMTKVGQSNLEERIRGYKDALAQYKDIEIVQIVDTQSDSVVAAQVATAVLRKNQDLAGLGCVEASGGVGAATAVRESGLVGKVKIVAMDRGNDILGLIRAGNQLAIHQKGKNRYRLKKVGFLLNLAHFKGHFVTGFGGAIKNIAMGLAAKGGKLDMHSLSKPYVNAEKCKICSDCLDVCPNDAISFVRYVAKIGPSCSGCASCIAACQYGTIQVKWNEASDVTQLKVAEYAKAILANRKALHFNFLLNLTPNCDCYPQTETPFMPDIGPAAAAGG